jgi:hypothetical protein
MDLSKLDIPQAAAAGRINGRPFKPDRAELKNQGVLTLRQGQGAFADLEVTLFLFLDKGQAAEGKTWEVKPATEFGSPHIHTSVLEGNFPKTSMYMNKYAMKLELGKESDGKVPGRIYLCLPDASQSHLAGTFTAQLEEDRSQPPRPADAPFIFGRVALKGGKKFDLFAGYVGVTAKGEPKSNGAGTDVEPGQATWVTSTTFAPQLSGLANDAQAGCTCRHTRLQPGRYLAYVRCGDRYLDWHWVEVQDQSRLTLEFTIDTQTAGTLQILQPPAAAKEKVQLIPLDAEGRLPELGTALDWVATAVKTDVPAKEGRVVLDGLRPGRYRVRAGKAWQDVTVRANETITADLAQGQ